MKDNLSYKRGIHVVCILAITLFLTVSNTSAYEKEINTLAAKISDKIASSGVKKVAVVDFTKIGGNVTELGRFIAEEFSVALSESGKSFQVVDRTHLKSIIKEHKLSETGLIDPQTARQLGKIAGVEALITGTITPFGDSVRLVIKVLNTETAVIIGSKRGNIPKTDAIEALIDHDIPLGGKPAMKQTKKLQKGEWIKKAKGFTFELVSCKKEGQNVECKFFAISDDKEKRLKLLGFGNSYYCSRLFDNFGNEYPANGVTLANCKSEKNCTKDLIRDIRTEAGLSFAGVASDATYAAVVELNLYLTNEIGVSDKFPVKFRNIPFK